MFTKEYKYHLLLGLVLSIWLYAFLVLVGPFDAQDITLQIRTFLMIGYGLVFFVGYAVFIPIQNQIYRIHGKWKFAHEVVFVLVFCVFVLPFCFMYYKTEAVNGTYTFSQFSTGVYLPIVALLAPVIFGGRFLIGRFGQESDLEQMRDKKITLRGDHKLDILQVPLDALVAVEAANNYVEVHYLNDRQPQKKLLRSTLSKVATTVPDLVKVHRSFLVNSTHFIEWKDSSTILVSHLEVPVSKKYKSILLENSTFAPK